jgi:hypothetical protein
MYLKNRKMSVLSQGAFLGHSGQHLPGLLIPVGSRPFLPSERRHIQHGEMEITTVSHRNTIIQKGFPAMRHRRLFFVFVLAAIAAATGNVYSQGHGGGSGHKKETLRVVVAPADTTVETGCSVAFSAYLIDKTGVRKDTLFQWSLIGGPSGNLTPDGVFTGTRPGQATVVASVGRLSGTAGVRVVDPAWSAGWRVRVAPADTAIQSGRTVQMRAWMENRDGMTKDTAFVWSAADGSVGFIDPGTGLFTGLARGQTAVLARVGGLSGRAHVTVLRDASSWKPNRGMHVEVTPRDTVTFAGGEIRFEAALLDSNGSRIDTAFVWSVEGSFGAISEQGLFSADTTGHGFVYASAGSLSGKAHVTVLRDSVEADTLGDRIRESKNRLRLVIVPGDTLVMAGESVAFQAFLVDTLGIPSAADVGWELLGRGVGTIDAGGLFVAERRGIGIVRARKEKYSATARVTVAGLPADTAGSDSAHVRFRDRDGGVLGHLHRLGEKDVLKISGLPFPLNFLNGGELAFQPGTLAEDVDIDISLPDSTVVDSSVSFPEGILTGAAFEVYVNGVPVHPFPFGAPVQVVFPLKRGLLERLGLIPEDLGVFFADSGGLDSSGVSDVVVDTASGLVFAQVGHFSTVVVARKPSSVSSAPRNGADAPAVFRLHGNFPNPFNPGTEIRFDLDGAAGRDIRLAVFNVLGQEIRTLFNGRCEPGAHTVRWDGRDAAGRPAGSGVYLIRLSSKDRTVTSRMALIR